MRRRRTKKYKGGTKRHRKTAKSFKKLNCSPKNKTKMKQYTCYSDEDLTKLKDMWNARHPDKPISTTDSKQIWQQLKDYYASLCNKESCWIRQMTKNTKMEKELLEASGGKARRQPRKPPFNTDKFYENILFKPGTTILSDRFSEKVNLKLISSYNISNYEIWINNLYYGSNSNYIQINSGDSVRFEITKK